jgi:peptide/nickel transport system permease protein
MRKSNKFLGDAAYLLRANPVTLAALAGFLIIITAALFGSWLAPYDPLASLPNSALQAPNSRHWFGTDHLGRDVFSRVLTATRLDLLISVSAVAISFALGSILGSIAGFMGGWVDRILGRVLDTLMAFPLFVENVILATAVINLPFYARVARAEVSVRKDRSWVQAAQLSGNASAKILFARIYPNILPPMMVQISLNMGWAILNAAGLSFIGLGVQPPAAEWGIMVAEGATYIVSGEWWLVFFPGLALMLSVFTFNLLGDGLRDMADPLRRT